MKSYTLFLQKDMVMFNIGSKVQLKPEYRHVCKFGRRGQIGDVSYIGDQQVVVWWGEKKAIINKKFLMFHKQTKCHNPPYTMGNCYATCLAHLTGIPLSDIPKIEDHFDDGTWLPKLYRWIHQYDYTLLETPGHVIMPGRYLVTGPSPNVPGVNHVCIYENGKLLFDPAHSNKGVKEILYTTFLVDIKKLRQYL